MKYIIPKTSKPKIILIPYPAQGHVTPMLKLASSLTTHGFSPVIITPEFIHHRISSAATTTTPTGITFMSIPDGLDENTPHDFFSIETAMETNMPAHLRGIVSMIVKDGGGVECMIVDLLASWAIGVGEQCGVKVAGFWPAMLATYRLIAAIPEMVSLGVINDSGIPQYEGPICLSSNQTTLSTQDLPWLIGNSTSRMSRFKFWKRTLDRSRTLPWLLVNTFSDELSHGKDYPPHIYPVGPLGQHTKLKNTSLWEEDVSCLDWLENQSNGSVIYISFGSWVSPIGESKVKSLANSLEASGRPFIWVLGFHWRQGMPDGYSERIKNKGKVVSWAPQMEVLKHKAVGCYLTHCGWNSTLEAIQCKKRLLCYPVAGDQFVNCAYIVDLWRIGIRVEGFGEKELGKSLKRVMDDDDMNERLVQLNERVVGNEANSRMIDSLRAFVDNLDKFQQNLTKKSGTEGV